MPESRAHEPGRIAPGLYADAAIHYDTRERAISDFVSKRVGQPTDSLYPLAVGRATLATCRAAYDRCVARDDTRPLGLPGRSGCHARGRFADDVFTAEPKARRRGGSR
jgi:hypothetical protein